MPVWGSGPSPGPSQEENSVRVSWEQAWGPPFLFLSQSIDEWASGRVSRNTIMFGNLLLPSLWGGAYLPPPYTLALAMCGKQNSKDDPSRSLTPSYLKKH